MEQPIVFAYWKDDEFKGFRADTFNTISKKSPKIYLYTKKQVEIVINNVKSGCNQAGTKFMKELLNSKATVINTTGEDLNDLLVGHLSRTEQKFREWKTFELRVHPFTSPEEFYSLREGDEWKLNKYLTELEPALEVHKFQILENEN